MFKKVNPKVKAGCGVISIFGLGFITGAVALFVIIVVNVQKSENWNTKESRNYLTNHFAKKLNLTEEQLTEFKPIVEEILERRWVLRRDYIEVNLSMIEDDFMPRMNEFLTEEQTAKAKVLTERWRRDDASKLERDRPETPGGNPE